MVMPSLFQTIDHKGHKGSRRSCGFPSCTFVPLVVNGSKRRVRNRLRRVNNTNLVEMVQKMPYIVGRDETQS